ncbi:hypothetical protein NBH00_09065 [Paraconexibacter antarcticus]|uniref:Uncharacterized protein n=1 Tax=Paraconexibacter antarcticus TaxID=2949664 RepID=A0ABY5DYD6_9ACTN|nr:hypothetical protein [Paraconexibacter antarcticus]UTI66343.1 hypothetical protein NBH00_09065 [Paraconexibacter antarcticus]
MDTITASPTLSITRDRGIYTIHALDLDGLKPVGTYKSASAAWAAIDQLDMPSYGEVETALAA